MDSTARKKLLLFEGHEDLTCHEIQAWKSAMCSMVGANQLFADKMKEAADVLTMFSELRPHNENTGNNSKHAAERVSRLLTKISEFHKEVFGDYMKFTNPEGPFGDLLKSNDDGFQLLKKKATTQLKEHQKLEKSAAKAWKYYMRRVKKNEKLELKLGKTLTVEELSVDKKFFISKRKMELALSRYNICYDNEVRQREGLAEQSESLKKEFLKEEKGKLDTIFFFINDALVRIEKLAPQGLNDNEDLDFEPEVARTKAMAKAGWEAHLKEHTFPERKGCQETSKGSEDMDDNDDDDDDDEASEDEDSEDDDSDDETAYVSGNFRGRRNHKKVRSLAAPKLNNDDSGMNDVLKEILEDLDTVPAFAKLEVSPRQSRPKERADNSSGNTSRRRRRSPEPSPESSKRRSRDSSPESQKQRSRDSSPDCRRRRARNPSPVARKRKLLRTTPESRKCRSPKSSSESRKQTKCDSSLEARNQIYDDSSQVSRDHRACNASPELEEHRAHDSSLEPEKDRAHDSKPGIERGDDSSLETMILEDLTTETTSCTSSSRGKSLPRGSLRRLDPDESISAPRSKSQSEARRKRRQLVTAGLSSTAQDFVVPVDIEHPPSFGENHWVELSRGSTTAPAERNLKKREQIDHRSNYENKDYEKSYIKSSEHQTDKDDQVFVRSESRRRRRAAKEAKNESDDRSTARHNDKPCHDNAIASHDKVSASHDEVTASDDMVIASHDDLQDKGSSSPRNEKGSKSAKKEPKRKVKMDNPTVKLPYDDEDNVVWKSNITVYVLQDREKQNSKEISIRAGMKLKQTRFTNPSGMAYGYKKTKLGLRKYGYYPAFLVALKPPVAAEK